MPNKRECGGCTMCCKLLAVDEIDKPSGTWCQHCDIGKGCKIYETRPDPCQGFTCAYIEGHTSTRPDKSKIVAYLHKNTDTGEVRLFIRTDRPFAVDPELNALMARARSQGIPVYKSKGKQWVKMAA